MVVLPGIIVLGLVPVCVLASDVDIAWMKTTLREYFSKTRHHVTNPIYKERAKTFIYDEFKSYGLDTHLHPFCTSQRTVMGQNVIAIQKGKNFNTAQDRVTGIAAHYDTMRNTPGVNDNGAAVVAMLAAAKHLAKTQRPYTLVFAAFDFEEWETAVDGACGSISCGSTAFVETGFRLFWDSIPQVTGVIVMDTIMNIAEAPNTQVIPNGFEQLFPKAVADINSDGKEGDFLAVIGRPYDNTLLKTFSDSYTALDPPEFELETLNITVLPGPTVTPTQFAMFQDLMRSDHSVFWRNSIPAIFLTDTAGFRGYMKTCYHKECDEMGRVTDKMMKFLGKTTQALINTVNLSTSASSKAGQVSTLLLTTILFLCHQGYP